MRIFKYTIYIGGVFMFCFILSGCFNKKIDIKNTKHFEYSYSVGNYMNASYVYELELNEDGKYIASYKADGVAEEDSIKKEITKEEVLNLEKILTKHKIYKWNGFNKAAKNVLDGKNFYLYYTREDDEGIDASGYMMYPKGYNEFKNDVVKYFNKLFKEEIKKKEELLK